MGLTRKDQADRLVVEGHLGQEAILEVLWAKHLGSLAVQHLVKVKLIAPKSILSLHQTERICKYKIKIHRQLKLQVVQEISYKYRATSIKVLSAQAPI